jgi:hypothetical protein
LTGAYLLISILLLLLFLAVAGLALADGALVAEWGSAAYFF